VLNRQALNSLSPNDRPLTSSKEIWRLHWQISSSASLEHAVALQEYPEARRTLIEKGRQLLRKDNLLDEEVAKRQDMEQISLEQKVDALESIFENVVVVVVVVVVQRCDSCRSFPAVYPVVVVVIALSSRTFTFAWTDSKRSLT